MIDTIVYNGIAEVYRLLIDISRTSVLSQSSIESNGGYEKKKGFTAKKTNSNEIPYSEDNIGSF